MNYSELLKINLIGGNIKVEDIQKIPITDLIILLDIMKMIGVSMILVLRNQLFQKILLL